jgi:hypothetical protein
MLNKFGLLCILFTASTVATSLPVHANTPSQSGLQKPPQFILFAFDGSRNIPMWKETRQFAKDLSADGKELKFTYFINTIYLVLAKNAKLFVPEWNRYIYEAPQLGPGYSALGYPCPGGSCGAQDISDRADQISRAFLENHEIASHAVGHFDANGGRAGGKTYGKWSLENWRSEHQQFFDLLFGALQVQRIQPQNFPPSGIALKRSNIVGFRAPQLGVGSSFDQSLAEQKFKYDTSRTNQMTYWPEKLVASKAWNMPLAQIPVYRKDGNQLQNIGKTLAMDYNFCVFQTQRAEGRVTGACNTFPERTTQFRDEMYHSYMQYFLKLYSGNRAPIQLGHHFSKWNNGAYWDAMKMFAEAVCGLPDVKCVTTEAYMKWLEQQQPETLKAYRNFKGTWAAKPSSLARLRVPGDFAPSVKLSLSKKSVVSLTAPGLRGQGYRTQIELNGRVIGLDRVRLAEIEQSVQAQDTEVVLTARLVNARGKAVNQSLHLVRDLGLSTVRLDSQALEAIHTKGDMPGAHRE